MSDVVFWMLELTIAEGKLDTLKSLLAEMSEATQANEPGALNYEWYISADESKCHILERYADSAALLTHLGNFSKNFASRFMGILTPTKMTVYGNPNEAAVKALNNLGAVYYEHLGGFSRDQL
ncbi:MAG: antibiotic biosynthesis monooxygenase [Anaerolineales bacterium]|nr:antibiotic biosynthesis monooxygenase [Anaerolineales bacterium]